jgi:uncharacterized protein with gpF-like domain
MKPNMTDDELDQWQRDQAIASFERMKASAESAERIGYKLKKQWLAANDRRVRPAHRKANGQIRELDELFDVGGEKLMHPHDPNGTRENTYLCRCVAIPAIFEKDSKGEWRMIK